jgi:hypothetical protein
MEYSYYLDSKTIYEKVIVKENNLIDVSLEKLNKLYKTSDFSSELQKMIVEEGIKFLEDEIKRAQQNVIYSNRCLKNLNNYFVQSLK